MKLRHDHSAEGNFGLNEYRITLNVREIRMRAINSLLQKRTGNLFAKI